MGRHTAKIANYYIEYGDYFFDYLKDKQSKEYYENFVVDATLKDTYLDTEIEIKIPLLELADIKLNRKTYSVDWSGTKGIHQYLYGVVIKTGVQIKGTPYVSVSNRSISKKYFLQSKIGDDNITLAMKPRFMEIKKYEDYKWMGENGLEFIYCVKGKMNFIKK